MRLQKFIGVLVVVTLSVANFAQGYEPMPPEVLNRICFIGDSITDGDTYPQLLRTAFEDAKKPPVLTINAGIGGDMASGMLKRLDRDVFVHRPTLVTFNAGANDAMHNVTVEDYERDVRAVAERMKQGKIPLILLTPSVLAGAVKEKGQANLDAYEAALRRVAEDYHLRIAEVNKAQAAAESNGEVQLAGDNLHPNQAGQRSIARAVMDALGYPEIPIPAKARFTLLPGILSEWKAREIPKDQPLTDQRVAELKPDASWMTLKLPETETFSEDWLDDLRQRGASMHLKTHFPKGGQFVAVATLESESEKQMYLHPAAEVSRVWINGNQVYLHVWPNDWTGYHIGRGEVATTLKKGTNTVVIETGPVFFISLTDRKMYGE